MTLHARQDIRNAIVSLLTDADTAAGTDVYKGRVTSAWQGEELPAIYVYATRESSRVFSESPRKYERVVRVSIEAIATGEEDTIEDILDQLALEIESVFDDNRYLVIDVNVGTEEEPVIEQHAQAADSMLSETSIDVKKEGDKHIGGIKIVYQVYYYTDSPPVISSLGEAADLVQVNVTYKASPSADDDDQLHDEIGELDQ